MAIPDFQSMMLTVLRSVEGRKVSGSRDVISDVTAEFRLTPEEQSQLLPSKTQRVVDNRVYWCLVYLQRAGLLNRPARGQYEITAAGKTVLEKPPQRIDIKFLAQFESFRAFQALSKKKGAAVESDRVSEEHNVENLQNPVEELETSYAKLRASVCSELLTQARQLAPTGFERLVVELLKRMGYGVDPSSVIHRGGVGDGGIDGEISQDPLGLDMIYVQAKRYQEGSGVGRPAIQQFVGSLNERKAKKGLFITTSHFTDDAAEYVQRIDSRVILIDGERLAEQMFEHGLGVVLEHRFDVKKLDHDFFEE